MYCICIVLILLTASFNVILSMLIEKSINISLAYEKGSLYWYLLFMMVTVLLYFLLLFIKMNLQVAISESRKMKLRNIIMEKALDSSKNSQMSADLSHINKLIFYDSKIVANREKEVVFKFMEIAFSVFGGLAYLYLSNFYIGLASTLLLFLFLYFSNKYSNVIRKLNARAIEISEAISGLFYDIFEASELIKIYQGRGFFTRRFEKGETEKEENVLRLDYKKSMLKAFTVLGIMTLQITTILIACFLLDVSKNAGMIVGMINVLIGSIFYPLIDIQDVIIAKNEYTNSAGRINAFVSSDSVEYPGDIPQDSGEIKKIAFDNVSFRYAQDCSIAYENFEFGKKEIVAVYGESGTGKTTIANLILNRLQPEQGEITVTDASGHIHKLDDSLKVSYLSSSNNLLRTSIIDNLRMGNEEIGEEEVINALKELNLFDKISESSAGINTVIGMEIDFSEGEKRRLCLIRAMLQAEDFVILDEPFASIDKDNIKGALKFISARRDRLGIIVISHDKDLDSIADRTYIIRGRKAL
ncbi:ATP-binding cassette domain-containing protein [Acetatifactor muris]|uniref:ATP-binding cassette domain-containing protein n=1 Tax=Acetatifactor muris TaxID=879566 RepID=UPI0023F113EE|nr:ABC transporter ATP-binding protein [Acetatifactor muris]